jgi:zinc transport system substrate-binding protein
LNGVVRAPVVFAVLVAALTGCRDAPEIAASPPRPLVVASFYPLYEFTRQIAGDWADVVSLVPTGVEPHDWEPAPADVGRVEKAALFVYQGADFDPGATRLARSVGQGRLALEATAGLPLLPAETAAHAGHRDRRDRQGRASGTHAHATGPPDPHVWLDPTLAQMQVAKIGEALAKIDAANAQHYGARAADYTATLGRLDEAYASGLAACARREIVVSHAAFTYLANRYQLRQIPVTGVAPQAEPSPADLARVVRTVRRVNARVVFFETLVSARLAETLAAEVGAKTMVLNPIEGLTAEDAAAGKDYVSLMQANLATLRTALECR